MFVIFIKWGWLGYFFVVINMIFFFGLLIEFGVMDGEVVGYLVDVLGDN